MKIKLIWLKLTMRILRNTDLLTYADMKENVKLQARPGVGVLKSHEEIMKQKTQ